MAGSVSQQMVDDLYFGVGGSATNFVAGNYAQMSWDKVVDNMVWGGPPAWLAAYPPASNPTWVQVLQYLQGVAATGQGFWPTGAQPLPPEGLGQNAVVIGMPAAVIWN
jgi:hypothetical protein